MRKYSFIKDSEYKHIKIYRSLKDASYRFHACIKETKEHCEYNLWYSDERELAKKVDIELIKRGQQPVNILRVVR